MKLLITTDTATEVWQYTTELCNSFQNENIEIILLSMGPAPSEEQSKGITEFENVYFKHFECKLEWMDQAWEDVDKSIAWIEEMIELNNPDVLHFNHFSPVNHFWNKPVVLTAHSSLSSWWNKIKKTALPERLELYDQMVEKAINNANVVVTTTKAKLRELEAFHGKIPNYLIIKNSFTSYDQEHQKSANETMIFSCARLLDESKNIRLLIEAAKNINAKIYIAGDNCQTLGQAENLNFLGNLSKKEISKYYQKCSVFVLPVKYDAYGYSFLEAASQKCALVGGDIETLNEIWGESMFYVQPDDAQKLAEICNLLISDKDKLNEMANKANETFKEMMKSNNSRQYLDIYKELIEINELDQKQFA